MTHEHLLIDASHLMSEPRRASDRERFYRPLGIELLGWLKYTGGQNRDNARLGDIRTAIEEALLYKQAGGGAIVDATSIGISRDPIGLARIARGTGLHIIMGASYYVNASHPSDMAQRTESSITDEIVGDVLVGPDGTGIKAGVIGEVGCTWPLTPNERKVLRASARAQRLTGAPLLIHPGRHETAPLEIVEVLREAGADLTRTIFSHIERTVYKEETLKELAETGCIIEYDLFGQENSFYPSAPHLDMPNDTQRLRWISWLISQGHGHQVVVAHDIDYKMFLTRYGGHGYAHILENIVPRMRMKGFKEEAIQAILVDTPKRVLTFVEPKRR